MSPKDRFGELDALRGIAVLMMVVYHLAFDLAYFYGFDIAVLEGGWWLIARTTATLFLLLIGICFMISWERASTPCFDSARQSRLPRLAQYSAQHDTEILNIYPKYLRRGLIIFSGGMVISLVTWFVAPDAYVKFGILHLIGVSALLQPFFARFKVWNAIPGMAIIAAGLWVEKLTTTSMVLFPVGIPYSGFASLDYYPLLPWFGVILIGMAIGQLLYVPEPRWLRAPQPFDFAPHFAKASRGRQDRRGAPTHALRFPLSLLWIGRKALVLYFLHQPILLLLLRLTLGPALRIHLR